jgi:hypothetical protein
MNFKFLKGKSWAEVTRDERYFNYELVSDIRKNKVPFFKLLGIKDEKKFDVELEVCFYRDLLKSYNIENIFSPKRTFDIALFSDDEIYIVETKAQQGFSKKQLKNFLKDKNDIKILFNKINSEENKSLKVPNVFICCIISSRYKPSQNTEKTFHKIIYWKDIHKLYKKDIYDRADNIYKQ